MQPNIAMKFAVAEYVIWILCKHCKFGEKIHYNFRDIKFLPRG